MFLPHEHGYKYRAELFVAATVIGGMSAALLVDGSLAGRLPILLLAIFVEGIAFFGFWLFFKLCNVLLQDQRARNIVGLVFFYFFSLGGLLNLLVIPVLDVHREELFAGAMMLSAGVGAASAAYLVLLHGIDADQSKSS